MEIGIAAILVMLAAIYFGLHVGVALLLGSFVAIWLLQDSGHAAAALAQAAGDSLRTDAAVAIPLFVLMAALVAMSGAGRAAFELLRDKLARVPHGAGLTVMITHALLAAAAGAYSPASAALQRPFVMAMLRQGGAPGRIVGGVAAGAALTVLLPTSLPLIVYAALTQQPLERLFVAGLIVGVLVMLVFCAIVTMRGASHSSGQAGVAPAQGSAGAALSLLALIVAVVGSVSAGWLTAIEAGGVGVIGAGLLVMSRAAIDREALGEAASVAASALFLLVAASLYARMLDLSGVTTALVEARLGTMALLGLHVVAVLLLAAVIELLPALVLVVPLMLPAVKAAGVDLAWFGALTLTAAALATIAPPFGIAVFRVKAALNDKATTLGACFAGVWPFALVLVVLLVVLVALHPQARA